MKNLMFLIIFIAFERQEEREHSICWFLLPRDRESWELCVLSGSPMSSASQHLSHHHRQAERGHRQVAGVLNHMVGPSHPPRTWLASCPQGQTHIRAKTHSQAAQGPGQGAQCPGLVASGWKLRQELEQHPGLRLHLLLAWSDRRRPCVGYLQQPGGYGTRGGHTDPIRELNLPKSLF